MSFYIDYRPPTIEEIVGNETTKKAVKALLAKGDKCPRVFLFSGESGCGKTTFGRAVANEIDCKDTDYREINSSDFRGVDMIRDLREQIKFAPLQSKYRVFLVDECHQLTKIAQDAFLKLLEDTPSHVFFILCTTDPQMLKSTVRNRCQQFKVEKLPIEEMSGLLKSISKKEKQKVSKKVIAEIAKQSDGCSREAIQMLEAIMSMEEEEQLTYVKNFKKVEKQGIELCRALMAKQHSWKPIASILQGLKGQDAEGIRRQVLGYAQAILLKGSANDRAGLILEEFNETTYNSGFPALVLMSYSVFKNS